MARRSGLFWFECRRHSLVGSNPTFVLVLFLALGHGVYCEFLWNIAPPTDDEDEEFGLLFIVLIWQFCVWSYTHMRVTPWQIHLPSHFYLFPHDWGSMQTQNTMDFPLRERELCFKLSLRILGSTALCALSAKRQDRESDKKTNFCLLDLPMIDTPYLVQQLPQ